MITQIHPSGDGRVLEKVEFSENSQVPLHSLNNNNFECDSLLLSIGL